MTTVEQLAFLGKLKDAYERAFALVRKVVERARKGEDNVDAAIAHIEDILDTLSAHPTNHDGAERAIADLAKFDEVLSGNDAAADRILRDKSGGVDPV